MPVLLSSDAHYATVRADLESDAQDLEAESWSLAVEQQHVKKHSKEMVKRQDVIYGKCGFLDHVYSCKACWLDSFDKLSSWLISATHNSRAKWKIIYWQSF